MSQLLVLMQTAKEKEQIVHHTARVWPRKPTMIFLHLLTVSMMELNDAHASENDKVLTADADPRVSFSLESFRSSFISNLRLLSCGQVACQDSDWKSWLHGRDRIFQTFWRW